MEEILRYLGVKDCDEKTYEKIKEMIGVSEGVLPEKTYACFDAEITENGVKLSGTDITLLGNLAKKHFSSCKKIIVVLATLGLKSEVLLKRFFAINASKAVILDAVFTDKLEKYLDDVESKLREEYGEITSRISCGYGDLPIFLQKDLFKIIDGERLGVKLNECFMLIPNKSVIALVGVKS